MAKPTQKPAKKPVRSAVKTTSKPAAKATVAKSGKVSKPQAPKAAPVAEIEEKDSGLAFDPNGAFSTAVGVAQYAFLSKPDTKYNEDKPVHKITVVFDPEDPEFDEMVERIKSFQEAYFSFKEEEVPDDISFLRQDDKLFDGNPHIVFKTQAKEDPDARDGYAPVPIFGPDGEPAPQLYVYSGDKVRVECVLAGFKGTGKVPMGIKPYLNAVQIVKKENSGSVRGGTFKKADGSAKTGGSFAKGNSGKGKPQRQADADEAGDDDDIPF